MGSENVSKTWIMAIRLGHVPDNDLLNGATEHGGHPSTHEATTVPSAASVPACLKDWDRRF